MRWKEEKESEKGDDTDTEIKRALDYGGIVH